MGNELREEGGRLIDADVQAKSDDIVARLRSEGSDAFAKHYSLGMWKLCADAADEIERLRVEVKRLSLENLHLECSLEAYE
jgi:hypothetical protein